MKTATQLSILILTLGLSTSAVAAGNTSVAASVNASTITSNATAAVTQEVLSEIKSHVSQTIKANLIELKRSTKAALIQSLTPQQKTAQQAQDKGQ
ncbi:hypothetical protein L1285_06395 [Pseudoalteromonas sp. DL2-H2.2]|uniref:hypothetical protein n=1 Tax=Pseudoalteromonas sp. DL2-H2.2 TaxID=2908889 RepID=UPI001F467CA4|nr:hypothetical protein [Pseudoalteromonas sp. DL2-H2.2]MCF2907954.1 hypothetical protein [Pseudoalteromonas sp. DL2-H2.2]